MSKTLILRLLTILLLASPATVWAGFSKCKINIEDQAQKTTYTVEKKVNLALYAEGGSGMGQRIYFDVPRENYNCQLIFFADDRDTRLFCEYTEGYEHWLFESFRGASKKDSATNNLIVSHNGRLIWIKTKCGLNPEGEEK